MADLFEGTEHVQPPNVPEHDPGIPSQPVPSSWIISAIGAMLVAGFVFVTYPFRVMFSGLHRDLFWLHPPASTFNAYWEIMLLAFAVFITLEMYRHVRPIVSRIVRGQL